MNIQNEAQKIHNQFGVSEIANYKIQLLTEKNTSEQILIFIDWFGTWQMDKNLDDYGINDIQEEFDKREL